VQPRRYVCEAGQVAPSPWQYQSRIGSQNSPFTRTWYHHAWRPAPLYVKQKAIHDLAAPAGVGDDAVAPHCLKYRMTSSGGRASGNQLMEQIFWRSALQAHPGNVPE